MAKKDRGDYFWFRDWLADTSGLSATTRGCWIDSICFLNESKGVTLWQLEMYAQKWRVTPEIAVEVLEELRLTSVADVEWQIWQNDGKTMAKDFCLNKWQNYGKTILPLAKDGKIVMAKLSCRRILRDAEKKEQTSVLRSIAGRIGANKRWQNGDGKNGTPFPSPPNNSEEKTSSDSKDSIPSVGSADNKKVQTDKAQFRSMPEDFFVTEAVRKWAIKNRLPSPDAELEAFKDFHTARGSRFKDWDAALRTWCRNAKKFDRSKPVIGSSKAQRIEDQIQRTLTSGLEKDDNEPTVF